MCIFQDHHTLFFKKTAEKHQVKKSYEITAQSATRWAYRYINYQQLIKHYDTVTEALCFETEQCEDTGAIEPIGIWNTIASPSFVVNFVCLY